MKMPGILFPVKTAALRKFPGANIENPKPIIDMTKDKFKHSQFLR